MTGHTERIRSGPIWRSDVHPGLPDAWIDSANNLVARARASPEQISRLKPLLKHESMPALAEKLDQLVEQVHGGGSLFGPLQGRGSQPGWLDNARRAMLRQMVSFKFALPQDNPGVVRARRKRLGGQVQGWAKALRRHPDAKHIGLEHALQWLIPDSDDELRRVILDDRSRRRVLERVKKRMVSLAPEIADDPDAKLDHTLKLLMQELAVSNRPNHFLISSLDGHYRPPILAVDSLVAYKLSPADLLDAVADRLRSDAPVSSLDAMNDQWLGPAGAGRSDPSRLLLIRSLNLGLGFLVEDEATQRKLRVLIADACSIATGQPVTVTQVKEALEYLEN